MPRKRAAFNDYEDTPGDEDENSFDSSAIPKNDKPISISFRNNILD
jgi:hypothetical protein